MNRSKAKAVRVRRSPDRPCLKIHGQSSKKLSNCAVKFYLGNKKAIDVDLDFSSHRFSFREAIAIANASLSPAKSLTCFYLLDYYALLFG